MYRFCLIIIVFIAPACNKYEFKDLSTTYINTERIELISSNGQNLSHNITDLWLFIEDGYAGTFSLPAHIPVLESGKHRVSIYPGIRNYGIRSKPEIYTLLNEYKTELDLQSKNEITVIPKYTYKSTAISYMQENFESSSIFIYDLDSFRSSTIIRSNLNARDGKYAGYGLLNSANRTIESSTNKIEISTSSKKSAYLEIDFISDTEMQIGLISIQGNTSIKSYFLTLNATPDWKKIYIPLYEIIPTQDGDTFQLAIKSELKSPASTAYFFIDNLKLICLP